MQYSGSCCPNYQVTERFFNFTFVYGYYELIKKKNRFCFLQIYDTFNIEFVFIIGQYLNINPSTLETLTRSGIEASESRARKADVDVQMNEDYMQPQCSTSTGKLNYLFINR